MATGPAPEFSATETTALYHCSDCNYCVDAVWAERSVEHVCATIEHHKPLVSYSGRGFIAAARAWHEGAALDGAALAERVFSCTTCGHCDVVCPIGLEPTAVARRMRTALLEQGHAPAEVSNALDALRRDGNPNGVSERGAWQADMKTTNESPEVLYLPGCAAATAHPAEARACVRLIEASGSTVTTLGGADSCCGAVYRELGAVSEADALNRGLAAKISNSNHGAATCVTSGQDCLHGWPDDGTAPVAFLSWVCGAVERGTLRLRRAASAPRSIAVLDSCQDRANEAPARLRVLLNTLGFTVTNADAAARHVVCCGAGGAMPAMHADSARAMAAARCADFDPSACEAVIGLDPRCVAHVAPSAGVPAFGLAEFLVEHCEAGQ